MDNEIVVAILIIGAGGAGYLLDRWIRRSPKTEDADSIYQTVVLRKLLLEEGISFEEARAMRERLYSGREIITPAIAKAIAEQQASGDRVPDDTVGTGTSSIEIAAGLSDRLDHLLGEIDFAMAEVMQGASPARHGAMRQAHAAWEEFVARESEVAGLRWEGGTGAPLLGLARKIELMETRLNELRIMKAEEDAL